MRYSAQIRQAFSFLAFAFYPKTTLIVCTVFSWIIIAILGAAMMVIPRESAFYDLVFALTTGAVGSSIVSLVVELSSNYKHNKLAFHELQDYYNAIIDHELYKQVLMQPAHSRGAEPNTCDGCAAADDIEDFGAYDQPMDIIQATWKQMPRLMPVFKATLHNHKEFLSDGEIDALESIVSEYSQIRSVLSRHLMPGPMRYDALNHPDETYLQSLYPADVLQKMPDWIRHHLASTESEKACSRYMDAVLSDGVLLASFTKDFDISQKGLMDSQRELDRREQEEKTRAEQVEEGGDAWNFHDPESPEPGGEAAFRARAEQIDPELEQHSKLVINLFICRYCQRIARSIDVLEKYIAQKPYYGLMLRESQNPAHLSLSSLAAARDRSSGKKVPARHKSGEPRL